MKALVYTAPETLVLRDVSEPLPAMGEELVRVESVGICGSDMHAYLGHDARRTAPLILGHEVAGVAAGARVTVNPLVTCGACPACIAGRDNLCPDRQIISMAPREGGFAEAVALPAGNLVALPPHMTADQGALCEPLACGWHAVRLARAHVPDAACALVIGGGAIGLGAALVLKAAGLTALRLVEPSADRRAYIRDTCGLDAVAPETVAAESFDIAIDGVGIAATRAQASALTRPGGAIVHIGLGSGDGGLDIRRLTLQEIAFIGSYTYTADDFRATAQAMIDGRLGLLDWIETRPLAEGARAFKDIRAGRVSAPKIVLKP